MASSSGSAGSERTSVREKFVSSSCVGRRWASPRADRSREFMIVRIRCFRSKLVLGEVLGQRVEQRVVGRRVGLAEVVVRIDDAAAHQVRPDAVGLGAGEERVLRIGDPVGQRRAGGRPSPPSFERRAAQEARLQDLAGDGMLHLARARP